MGLANGEQVTSRWDGDYDVIIAGGGPAGSAAAIRLAEAGIRTIVVEKKHMPREKLCGEFIAPECFPTLRRLGVMDMLDKSGAASIRRLILVAPNGRTVRHNIREVSRGPEAGLSLRRACFDNILFVRAREAGAVCLEGVSVRTPLLDKAAPIGVEAMRLADGGLVRYRAPIVLDASGHGSRLAVAHGARVRGRTGSRIYAMRAHLREIGGFEDQVELYFFPGGYGGLSPVDGGLANLCLLVNERLVKNLGGDPDRILSQTVMRNERCRAMLRSFEVSGGWSFVGPLHFGSKGLTQNGVISIGDAAGMIDPFTGSGIQIALRSGEIAAESIISAIGPASSRKPGGTGSRAGSRSEVSGRSEEADIAFADSEAPGWGSVAERALALYKRRYAREFGAQMRAARLLRPAAMSGEFGNVLIEVLRRLPSLAGKVVRSTRSRRLT